MSKVTLGFKITENGEEYCANVPGIRYNSTPYLLAKCKDAADHFQKMHVKGGGNITITLIGDEDGVALTPVSRDQLCHADMIAFEKYAAHLQLDMIDESEKAYRVSGKIK